MIVEFDFSQTGRFNQPLKFSDKHYTHINEFNLSGPLPIFLFYVEIIELLFYNGRNMSQDINNEIFIGFENDVKVRC